MPYNDPAFFEYFGLGLIQGQHLYVDLNDVKLPSIFFVNALWQELFGQAYLLHTCAEAAVNLVSIRLFTQILRYWRIAWPLSASLFAAVFCLAFPHVGAAIR